MLVQIPSATKSRLRLRDNHDNLIRTMPCFMWFWARTLSTVLDGLPRDSPSPLLTQCQDDDLCTRSLCQVQLGWSVFQEILYKPTSPLHCYWLFLSHGQFQYLQHHLCPCQAMRTRVTAAISVQFNSSHTEVSPDILLFLVPHLMGNWKDKILLDLAMCGFTEKCQVVEISKQFKTAKYWSAEQASSRQ